MGDGVGVGIVGYGRIGHEHAGWIGRGSSAHVVAVTDPTPARRALAERGGAKVYDDLDAMLKDEQVEAVLVSTPTSLHFDQAMEALAMGKHVMVEKPMTLDIVQASDLVEQARSCRRVLSVFHNRRWDADFLAVGAAIKSGVFGKVTSIESRLGQWGSCVGPATPDWRPNWRNEAAWGGGGLLDWGSHFIDQIWRLMWPARPVRIYAQLRGNVWTQDSDDFARVLIDFDGGAVGMVEINTATMHPLPRWHIDGTAGTAESPFSREFDVNRWAELDFSAAGGEQRRRLPAGEAGLSEVEIWDRFARAVRGEGKPAVTAESVVLTMALLDMASESSRLGIAIPIAESEQWVY
ncbi:MAG TPA: Gfo/Idh/MocA family oxidoreductase [Tepidisphaeraceae bacterium]|nr:Gfo/Idh/MocA family oxidoreductase [Tepidisphaeraceae bacterium]